jgi:hypothetical protein
MSEDRTTPRRFQVSLSAAFVFVASLCAGFALIKTDLPEMALAVFPFAVGMIVGQLSTTRTSSLLAPIVAAIVVPLLWGGIGGLIDPAYREKPIAMNAIGGLILCPGVLIIGAVPAIAGSEIARWLNRRRLFRKFRIRLTHYPRFSFLESAAIFCYNRGFCCLTPLESPFARRRDV